MALLNRGLELQRIHLHDRGDGRVLADVLARLHEPLGDRSRDRRAHDGVVQFLLRQLERGAAILEARFEAADAVDRRLVVRLRDLQARFRGVVVDLRHQAAPVQLIGALERVARIVAVRDRLPDRGDLIVGGRLLVLAAIDAELRFDLPQRALGAVDGELQLTRVEADEAVARPHLGAELHRHVEDAAAHFAAHSRLVGREQRSGQIDLALNGDSLQRRGVDRNRRAAAAAPPTTAAAAGTRRFARRRVARRQARRGDEREHEREMTHAYRSLNECLPLLYPPDTPQRAAVAR